MAGAADGTSPENNLHLERWLRRHGLADAYARWRHADAAKAPTLAFTAIASEPRLLMRLREPDASMLVRQAERVVVEVGRVEASEPTLAAARAVVSRIALWRNYAADTARRNKQDPGAARPVSAGREGEATTGEVAMRDASQKALAMFPQFAEAVARPLVDTTCRLGAERLARLREPMGSVMALNTARFAARSSRGHLRGPALRREECLECIRVVQGWSGIAGKNPFIVPYAGREGSIYDRALALFVDAASCVSLAADLPDGPAAQGFPIWEAAEEFHAYAMVCLNPNALPNMSLERAQACAAAAGRLAAAHLAEASVALPEIPDFCEAFSPKMVLAMSRSVIRGEIPARRSAAAAARGVAMLRPANSVPEVQGLPGPVAC